MAIPQLEGYIFARAEPLADKLMTRVSADNPHALRNCLRAEGFSVEEINRASLVRSGKLVDQVWIGSIRAEWESGLSDLRIRRKS